MWRLDYDAFVKRHCKERAVVFPQFGTKMYRRFGGKTPVSSGMVQGVVDSIKAGDIEKGHGHFGGQAHSPHDAGADDFIYDFEWGSDSGAAEASFDSEEAEFNDPLNVYNMFEGFRRQQGQASHI